MAVLVGQPPRCSRRARRGLGALLALAGPWAGSRGALPALPQRPGAGTASARLPAGRARQALAARGFAIAAGAGRAPQGYPVDPTALLERQVELKTAALG